MFTELKDRVLWYDGHSSVEIDILSKMILNGDDISDLFVLENDEEVENYNKISSNKLEVKYSNNTINTEWNIPDVYKQIDLESFVLTELTDIQKNKQFNVDYCNKSMARVYKELALIKQLNLTGLFLCIIYLIDVFKEQNIIWGVGRGSSCASYILYILDLHCVDAIEYDISENEFFKDTINKVHT